MQGVNILVIDDESTLRRTLRTALESMGHRVAEAANSAGALILVAERPFDVAFLDLRLGRETGLELLKSLRDSAPSMGIVVVTAHATIASAVEAMRQGAFDYLPKPFTPDQLRLALERWQTVQGLKNQVSDLQDQVRSLQADIDLETQEPAFREALEVAFRVAQTEATILLRGESGTGKGVVARAIQARSPRAKGPFVTVHCPSLSAELLESELFGHARGAFTGAVQSTEGKVAAAEGGVLFLDEVGDLPFALQPKLLRFLQDKQYERVGESKVRTGNARIISATNRNLDQEVKAGRFREDLLYRLNVIEVILPPLRERRRDMLPLANHLLRFFAKQAGKPMTGFTEEARKAIEKHSWPGNLRELRNAVERAVILATGQEVTVEQLPSQIGRPANGVLEIGGALTLDQLEAEHIRRVQANSLSLEETAKILGIDPSTLYRKRKRLGL
jgi:NtrC-family two-component system response regulator AlgB